MLSSQQLQMLHRALLSAFNSQELEELIRTDIGAPLNLFVSPGPLSSQLFEVIQSAERAGWTPELVRAAYSRRPNNPQIAEIYEALGFAIPVTAQTAGVKEGLTTRGPAEVMERVVGPQSSNVDVELWRNRLQSVQAQVCRVEVQGSFTGTGFLVGPDAVLTCQCVMQDVIDGSKPAASVRVRFDYGPTSSGGAEGLVLSLQSEWLIDASPPAEGESGRASGLTLPTPDQLDYALLRLERAVGVEQVAGTTRNRGWVDLAGSKPVIEPSPYLMIVQYRSGGALSLQIDNQGTVSINGNGTRVMYRTATEPGSAGAPCFNEQWEILAMNEATARFPNDDPTNIGIPAAAIRDRLIRTGHQDSIAAPSTDQKVAEELTPGRTTPPEPGPVIVPEDPQKGRWGGLAERDGLRLSVTLKKIMDHTFVFDAVVESVGETALNEPVIFHLHDSYPTSVIWIRRIRDGRRAVLEDVESYGVYTIGVQVRNGRGEWIGLEFALSGLPDLPEPFLQR